MAIANFYRDLEKDYHYVVENTQQREDPIPFVMGASLGFRGVGMITTICASLSLLETKLHPKLTVASLVSKLFFIILGYDLVVTGINLRNETNIVSGRVERLSEGVTALVNMCRSLWKNGITNRNDIGFFDVNLDRFLKGTYILDWLYHEAKGFHEHR